jgi:hypothetical protein
LLPSRVKPENTRLVYIQFTLIDDARNANHLMKNARTSGEQGLTLLYETYGFATEARQSIQWTKHGFNKDL